MNRHGYEIGVALACALGTFLMADALFGHQWLVGERGGLQVGGGIIDVHFCSAPDDPDPIPMGIGDLEGCYSEMYAQSELRREAGSWFGATTHMTLFFGAGSALLLLLFAAIRVLAMDVEVVSRRQKLALQLFDIQNGAVQAHTHPGVAGVRMTITSWVALAIATASAPESLAIGKDLVKFVIGSLLAAGGAVASDPGHFLPSTMQPTPTSLPETPDAGGEEAAQARPEPLPEAEIEVDENPACVKCEGNTLWLEKAGRHRCQKCGLYQPLHAPGSQVDRP